MPFVPDTFFLLFPPFSSFFLLFPAHDQKSRNVEGLRRPDLNQIKTADGPMILTPRRTYAGRGAVRRTLYMAALVCTRHNPKLKAFYQRLLARGKQKKVAIIAVMRKTPRYPKHHDQKSRNVEGLRRPGLNKKKTADGPMNFFSILTSIC